MITGSGLRNHTATVSFCASVVMAMSSASSTRRYTRAALIGSTTTLQLRAMAVEIMNDVWMRRTGRVQVYMDMDVFV
jgi:hypothetical protein